MALIIMIGTYKNIKDSRAENVIELTAIALDNYGYLENEEFTLEAKQIENDLYEIKLPECDNTKKINNKQRPERKFRAYFDYSSFKTTSASTTDRPFSYTKTGFMSSSFS